MASITTKAGPWNMTVFAFDEGDASNPLGRVAMADVGGIPFGAAELDRNGKVIAYNDTEPEDADGAKHSIVGCSFFDDVLRWSECRIIAEEFGKGVASGDLNVVFDCEIARLAYKVRIHLKVSPILGTYWVFIKRLYRSPV